MLPLAYLCRQTSGAGRSESVALGACLVYYLKVRGVEISFPIACDQGAGVRQKRVNVVRYVPPESASSRSGRWTC